MDVHYVGHSLDSSMCSAWRVSFKLEVSARNTELSRHSIYSPTRSALSTASLHGGTCPILSPGTLLLHCYYSASYLITLFCPGGVAGPPNADCYPTAQSLLFGWSDGLEWSTGCAASDASSPLGSFFSLGLRPHCLTEVGLGVLLSRFP